MPSGGAVSAGFAVVAPSYLISALGAGRGGETRRAQVGALE